MGGIAEAPRPAVIAIGSNLGDRHAAISFAVDRLSRILTGLILSDIIETHPEGDGLEHEPLFLNAAVRGSTTLGARALLDLMLAIERDFGRERPYPGAARTLDLDLIVLGDETVKEPGLHLPHPRFRDRFFVLGPVTQVAPDLRDPVSGMTMAELLKRLLRDESR